MEDLSALVQAGLRRHDAGDHPGAEKCYLQALERDPKHADALYLLGALYLELDRPEAAETLTRRALQRTADRAEAHFNLGLALQAQGRSEDAAACYETCLTLSPDDVDAHYNLGMILARRHNFVGAAGHLRTVVRLAPGHAEAHASLGNVLADLGMLDEAVAAYHESLRLAPENARVYYALGNALRKQKRFEDAASAYAHAVRIRPDHHDAHNNLANVLRALGRQHEAEAAYRIALALQPESAGARINLGNVLVGQGRFDEAIACYQEVLTAHAGHPDARNSLGNVLVTIGRLDEAVACYEAALRHRPEFPVFHLNLGNAHRARGDIDAALACYERALQARPNYPGARWNRSLAWLLAGQFERGWLEYEARWEHRMKRPQFDRPAWDGSPLDGRTILLYAEQGLGDTLQFIRFAPDVRARAGRVVVACQPRLVPLLSRCAGIDSIVSEDGPLPALLDVYAPLMGLPRLLGAGEGDWSRTVPYVVADDGLVAFWSRVIDECPGRFNVGVIWQGNPKNPNDRQRSFRLAELEPVARIPGVRLISLQKGPGEEQLHASDIPFPIVDLGARLGQHVPFLDEAAVMRNLDLVIACDSAMAHLAGGLGRPVWIPLPFAPDWRWMLEREDSPWYPTMRLFRQTGWGEWPHVFARIADAITPHAREHQRRHMLR